MNKIQVMVHIARWEAELVKLLWQIQRKQKPATLLIGDIDVDRINDRWFQEGQAQPLERVLEDFENVRLQLMRRIEDLNDEDLNDANRYPWLGGDPLWRWIAADSFEHEAEHAEHIRSWKPSAGAPHAR